MEVWDEERGGYGMRKGLRWRKRVRWGGEVGGEWGISEVGLGMRKGVLEGK